LLSYLIKEREEVRIYRQNKKPSFAAKTNDKGKSLRITSRLFPLFPKKTGVTSIKNDSVFDISLKTKVRKKYHYDGKLYVLIDGGCFSATAMTAAFLKKNKRATFIGEETGGGEKGCNAMIMSDLELPNTKLRYRFPFFRVEHQLTPEKVGRGIFPDIYIQYDVKSILENKDLEMEKVRSLVN
jgi:C-terminal processing protease CtpA/Prc